MKRSKVITAVIAIIAVVAAAYTVERPKAIKMITKIEKKATK